MNVLQINASNPYSLFFMQNIFKTEELKNVCLSLDRRVVVISDHTVKDLWGDTIQQYLNQHNIVHTYLSFPPGEAHKTRETKDRLEDQLLHAQYGRDTCIIALGGGIVLDLVGFLAATYCRGVPAIYIPTSLLAMVDASMGGKTGVNTPFGKNLIGTITPPHSVFIDIAFLETLPQTEWKNGYVEMIKHGLIADAKTFAQLNQCSTLKYHISSILQDLIYTSCQIKRVIIEQDETEKGLRQLLNFGHTIGHAIEVIEHYQMMHGEAVAIGMLVECYLSYISGVLSKETLDQVYEILKAYELPLKTRALQDSEKLIQHLLLDKKAVGQIPRFVLLEQIGKPHCDAQHYTWPVEFNTIKQALVWANQQFGMEQS